MSWKRKIAACAVVAATLAACAGQNTTSTERQSVPEHPAALSIEPYQPRFERERPVVAVVAHHAGAELTDFVVPYGVLAASGSADLVTVSTAPGPIDMFPALTIEADATVEEFDRRYPKGADYVVVPAVHEADDPDLLAWIREQEGRGATLVGVCDGVLVLANAGALDGRYATAHWYSINRLERKHPQTEWVRDRRYVADQNVITTTGVSASIPVSIALVEAIAGTAHAAELAASLGVEDWSTAHDSDVFGITAGRVLTLVRNGVAFWRRDEIEIGVEAGLDEITLALAADLWSRTYRSNVVSSSSSGEPFRTRGGLRLVPDRAHGESGKPDRRFSPPDRALTGSAIDITLDGIADAYGRPTADLVALQIEHQWIQSRDDVERPLVRN